MNKYKIIKSGKNKGRIQALKDFGNVRKGDIGGFVEFYKNLSQEGLCWVCGYSRVFGDAWVYENARVYGDAQVYGDARVYGDAQVYGNARVCGYSRVFGDARVYAELFLNKGDFQTDILKDLRKNLPEIFDVVPTKKNTYLFYKRVNKKGKRYYSLYDPNFEYQIGKLAKVKDYNLSHESCSSGIHVSTPNYWDQGNCLLECEVKVEDIITCGELKLRCKAVKVIREVKFK